MSTLVFRDWAWQAALDLLTDGRSAKPVELAHQPEAGELCCLLPRPWCNSRMQGGFRPCRRWKPSQIGIAIEGLPLLAAVLFGAGLGLNL